MSSNQRTETSFRKQQNKLFESFIFFFFLSMLSIGMHWTKFPQNKFNLDIFEFKTLGHSISFINLNGITWAKDTVCVSW